MRWAGLLFATAFACESSGPSGSTDGGDLRDSDPKRPDATAIIDAATIDATELDATAADASNGDSGLRDADDLDANLDASAPDASAPDAGQCQDGTAACPFLIDAFPYSANGDTRTARSDSIDSYDCAPSTNESGREIFYRLTTTRPGLLRAWVDDVAEDSVDVDLHLLEDGRTDGTGCIARDNVELREFLESGSYLLVVDTWVNGSGTTLGGAFTLDVELTPLPSGPCELDPTELAMVWADCRPGTTFRCYEAADPVDGQTRRFLSTPAFGPAVKEAHLVTVADGFGGSWPSSFTDGIQNHYILSQATTAYVMNRTEPWAPAGEGGSEFGQSAYGQPLPVLEEAWYVNMYWRRRPAPGTRMLAFNPNNGRAVVLAGGYETGPGANDAIGGFTEEAHHALGTAHRSSVVLGFVRDQTLTLGPIHCP
ncbi:MAG: hypothetical protein HYV07_06400 [Deltaproteobacteria bacterium]|nr:hypothetical protein [Deltaproteobacteria bacterium]